MGPTFCLSSSDSCKRAKSGQAEGQKTRGAHEVEDVQFERKLDSSHDLCLFPKAQAKCQLKTIAYQAKTTY
jgi:hypothetical protein